MQNPTIVLTNKHLTMNYLLLISFYFLFLLTSNAQNVNAYAKVTGITGNTLTLSNVNETSDSFEDGEQVIVFQVQDDVKTPPTNSAASGDLNAIVSAGLFEVVTILSHTENSGVPNSITLNSALSNSYNTGANSSLQIISFPELGAPNFSTTSAITGLPWNGNIGGVVAFQVTNKLTLNHNVSANGIGFRGGSRSRNAYGSFNCTTGTVVFESNSNQYGEKGEGIHKRTNANVRYGRGKMINGGGGGSHHNGGGGGGANQTPGGAGGTGYNGTGNGCPVVRSCGGVAGIGLHNFINNSRLFLGGGGGGGQQNNSRASSGANGGGFVFIQADSLELNCGGTVPVISANGSTAANGGNDGIGGGGAGGSVLMDVQEYVIPTGCTLEIQANGGNGGSVNSGVHHGAGGGGGQGAIRFRQAAPATVTTTATSGSGGCNNAACTSVAENGVDSSILLSVDLTFFEASYQADERHTVLDWGTEFEVENAFFEVQKSKDGFSWETLTKVPSMGNSRSNQYYQHIDNHVTPEYTYYRLKQVDQRGQYVYSSIRSVYVSPSTGKGITLAPNPASDYLELRSEQAPITYLKIYTATGQIVSQNIPTFYSEEKHHVQIQLQNLEAGIYILHTNLGVFKVQKI